MSFRAEAIGRRLLEVLGGSDQVIYVVTHSYSSEADFSRGVRDDTVSSQRLLHPRPTYVPLSASTISRSENRLRMGDSQMEIVGSQITVEELQNPSTRIWIGEQEFEIVDHMARFIDGEVSHYILIIRGVVKHYA